MRQLTVYGTWLLIVLSFVLVVFLAIGLIVWAPIIIAVAIALIVIAGVVWSQSRRRTRQVGAEHAVAAEERRDAGQTAAPECQRGSRVGRGRRGRSAACPVTREGG